ncbi:MAG: class I tRNA ligase family protein, partial [Myxococcaceae bacterium]
KSSLYGTDEDSKNVTRAVLVFCLDRILRLLHPFMPFITEEIWQKLPMARPTDSIMIAPFPRAESGLHDEAAEAEMRPVIQAIEGLRTIRGESNLSPASKLEAIIQSRDEKLLGTLEKWRSYLMPLAGLSKLTVSGPGPKPAQSAAAMTEAMEIFVPLAGLIDFDEERKRIDKELQKIDQELSSISKKMENPNFVQRAPPEVVAESRARIDELTAKKAKLKEHLSRLSPEGAMNSGNNGNNGSNGQQSPAIASVLQNPETAKVKVAPEAEGNVDLSEELADEIASVKVPAGPDAQVTEALDKLREGTKEGLSARDHQDLGVAYLNMGLVDDAVREFKEAEKGGIKSRVKQVVKKVSAPKKPAKKKAPARASAKKVTKAKLTVQGKKPGARKKAKAAIKKAVAKVKAKLASRKTKKPAGKGKKKR